MYRWERYANLGAGWTALCLAIFTLNDSPRSLALLYKLAHILLVLYIWIECYG